MRAKDLSPLEKLAVECALMAPTRQGRSSQRAGVPWSVIDELRAELERLGFDFKAMKADYDKRVRASRDETYKEHLATLTREA